MNRVMLVDTNIFLRHLLQDIPEQGEQSTKLLHRARVGEVSLYAPSTVFFELTHFLHRTQKIPRQPITRALLDILSIDGVSTDHPKALVAALLLWEEESPLSFPDCFHLALAKQLGMPAICTYDKKMDRYPGVERVEP